uniref:Uncharacterized protein n=1 Tax=Oryza glumipatula TaxID=40148 RepID=A0A0E0BIG7_9ORYZ
MPRFGHARERDKRDTPLFTLPSPLSFWARSAAGVVASPKLPVFPTFQAEILGGAAHSSSSSSQISSRSRVVIVFVVLPGISNAVAASWTSPTPFSCTRGHLRVRMDLLYSFSLLNSTPSEPPFAAGRL